MKLLRTTLKKKLEILNISFKHHNFFLEDAEFNQKANNLKANTSVTYTEIPEMLDDVLSPKNTFLGESECS